VAVLKRNIRFLKLFLDIDLMLRAAYCARIDAGFLRFSYDKPTNRSKEGTLFIDPGFPVHKQQCKVLGHDYYSFDIYEYRGRKLRNKLESYLDGGKISSLLYSNPNNPSWICLNEEELHIIGDLATKYDVVVIEDLAYFGMDFRNDISVPGKSPFQPTVAKYTDNYILLVSTSKVFSYAGQRIAMMAVSNQLFNRKYPDLKRYYTSDLLGHTIIYGALYALSAGASHSAQLAIASIMKAVNDGHYNLLKVIRHMVIALWP
jgi:aspartate/methionine/tyrosine aminotransferase